MARRQRQVCIRDSKMVVTGYPVRPEIRAARRLSRADALARFDLRPGRPTLFVFGGSRGARAINRALMGVLPDLLACLLYTSDAADERPRVDLGGRRTIKHKNTAILSTES